ncbi:hypothetical protein ARMGADRAFT_1084601 [Armillaria gallica]|uniref:Uncharacterized protein n=1 Tax=Armillaria gallica TaxID=47427 RepID=A0A2H3D4F8_ARMGA|nr:hypothetical protein ARMGADRAFT_1084601 [Armillaria gallica]
MSTPQDQSCVRRVSPSGKQALGFDGQNKGTRERGQPRACRECVPFCARASNPRVSSDVDDYVLSPRKQNQHRVQVRVIEGDGGDGGDDDDDDDDDDDARSHSLLSFLGWLPKYRFLRLNDVLQTQESSIVYGALALRRLPSTPRILTLPSTRTSDVTCFIIWYNILLKWTVGDTGSQSSDELYLPGNLSQPRWSNTLILSASALLVQRHPDITTRSLCTRPSKRTETERLKDGQYMLTRRRVTGASEDYVTRYYVYTSGHQLTQRFDEMGGCDDHTLRVPSSAMDQLSSSLEVEIRVSEHLPAPCRSTSATMSPQTRDFIILTFHLYSRKQDPLMMPFFAASGDGQCHCPELVSFVRRSLSNEDISPRLSVHRHVRSLMLPLHFPGKGEALSTSHSHGCSMAAIMSHENHPNLSRPLITISVGCRSSSKGSQE